MNKELEEAKKKIKEYIYLVSENNYCDCNELNCLLGDGDKFCDGSKVVAKAAETVLTALENSIPKQVVEDKIKGLKEEFRANMPSCYIGLAQIDILQELLERR